MKTLATITLKVPQCGQGLHLRWYANGWHYVTLKVGDEAYLTAGLNSNTEANAKQRVAVEDVPSADIDALVSLARVGSFDVLTPKGWRNATMDGGDLTTYETGTDYYRAEFVLNVYGKTYAYSPVVLEGVDPIVLLFPLSDIAIHQGDPVVLPGTVKAKYESGKIADVAVTWGPIGSSNVGTFVVSGSVVGTDLKASVKLIVTALTDLDILRRIRDANPTSQLPALWLDSEDPYTQWKGIGWSSGRVYAVSCSGYQQGEFNYGNLIDISLFGKLTSLTRFESLRSVNTIIGGVDLSKCVGLWSVQIWETSLQSLVLPLNFSLNSSGGQLYIRNNKLTAVPSLTSKGNIVNANFIHNLMPPTETDRLLALGFTPAQVLPQDI